MSDTNPVPPGEGLDVQYYYDLLNDMSDDEVAAWVQANYWSLSPNGQSWVGDWLKRTDRDVQEAGQFVFGAGYGTEAEGLEPPDPSSSTDVIEYLRELGPENGTAWLEAHADEFDEAVTDDVDAWVAQQPEESGWGAALPTTTATADVAVAEAEQQVAIDDATEAATTWYAEHLGPDVVTSGTVPELPTDLIPPGLSGQALDQWIAEVTEAGAAQAQEDAAAAEMEANPGMTQEEAQAAVKPLYDNLGINRGVPGWILQAFGGWHNFTPEVRQRFVDYWNDDHGTNFTSFSQIAPILEEMGQTTYTTEFTKAVMDDQEPLISHPIDIPFVNGTRRVNFTPDEMAELRVMGFDNNAIIRLVRLNGIHSGVDAIHAGPTGDTMDIFAMAGLARYYGAGQEFAATNQTDQDIAALEQQLGLEPGEYRSMNAAQRKALRKKYEDQFSGLDPRGADISGGRAQLEMIGKLDALLAPQQGTRAMEEGGAPGGMSAGRTVGVMLAQGSLQRGMATYNGDEVLAFISAVDPALAQRIAASGQDPTKLDWQDNLAALNILDRGGLSNRGNTPYERLGGHIRQHIFSQLSYFDTTGAGGGGGGGGATTVRRMLDPVSIKEQLQQKFADLMLPDIPDAVVSSVQNMLQAQLDQSPEGMSFDVSARILDWVQGRPEYAELYGKKPQGMTEGEYQGQFQAGVQDMLGAQADPDAVKAGLRTNDYQAAVGVAGIGGLAGQNSRLLGRWALAKQTLDKFT